MRSRLPELARSVWNEVADAELLRRYATDRSDEDFAHLVARYGRLVWGQCRHLLANEADAEDAFQATFIVLARSVQKLTPGAPLGPWLHGTAYRVCMKARRSMARRARGERAAAAVRVDRSQPVADSVWESAFAALCEEVHQLPESLRAAFVLCGLEGRTQVDAAAALGQKIGTFSARLKRAKQTLLKRLAKRGFGAGAIALGTVAGRSGGAPAALIGRTLSLHGSRATVPCSVLVLTQGVTGMGIVRLKVLVFGILVAGGLALSVVSGLDSTASGQPPADPFKSPDKRIDEYRLPAGVQPPGKGDPEIEKARAEVEKARRALEKAAEDLRQKEADGAARRAERPSGKFTYVPVPREGFTTEEFEKRIAEHEQQGLSYSGEATIRTNQGPERMLVFRSKARTPGSAPEKPETSPFRGKD